MSSSPQSEAVRSFPFWKRIAIVLAAQALAILIAWLVITVLPHAFHLGNTARQGLLVAGLSVAILINIVGPVIAITK
jgi:hypothetical protein